MTIQSLDRLYDWWFLLFLSSIFVYLMRLSYSIKCSTKHLYQNEQCFITIIHISFMACFMFVCFFSIFVSFCDWFSPFFFTLPLFLNVSLFHFFSFLSYFLSFTLLFLLISLSIFVFLSQFLSFFLIFCLSFSIFASLSPYHPSLYTFLSSFLILPFSFHLLLSRAGTFIAWKWIFI